ncbi:MAG TPA: DUF4321 domain-containing protein [Desulfotomaculum sp.]|nr:DUF4321 domain-containing protein [Desulfotomaculum sp.]
MAKNIKIKQNRQNPWVLALLLIVGGLIGNVVAGMLTLPVLKATASFGFPTVTLDLSFFKLIFGLTIALGPLTVLGMLFGYFLYKRL